MGNKIKKWQVLSEEMVFEKYGRGIKKVIFRLPNGKKSDFYLKSEKNAAGILALTPQKQVILAKQYRPGINKIVLELPGGAIEPGNNPQQAAERELLEETGYRGKLQLVTYCYDCAYSNLLRYCFVATDCKKIAKQSLEESEFVEIQLVSLKKFRQLLRSGELTDVEIGYLGLDYLNLL